jgi:hypothetical protein
MERSGDRSRFSDRGSYSLILILLWIALGLDSALSFLLPQASILWNRIAIFYLGVSLMPEAMAFRFYAMSILGRFFTYDVAVHVGQTVVEAGPYRYIRHQRIREVSSLSPDLVWRSEIGPVFWRFWLRRGQAIAVEYLSKKPHWLRPWASPIGSICVGPGASSHLRLSQCPPSRYLPVAQAISSTVLSRLDL